MKQWIYTTSCWNITGSMGWSTFSYTAGLEPYEVAELEEKVSIYEVPQSHVMGGKMPLFYSLTLDSGRKAICQISDLGESFYDGRSGASIAHALIIEPHEHWPLSPIAYFGAELFWRDLPEELKQQALNASSRRDEQPDPPDYLPELALEDLHPGPTHHINAIGEMLRDEKFSSELSTLYKHMAMAIREDALPLRIRGAAEQLSYYIAALNYLMPHDLENRPFVTCIDSSGGVSHYNSFDLVGTVTNADVDVEYDSDGEPISPIIAAARLDLALWAQYAPRAAELDDSCRDYDTSYIVAQMTHSLQGLSDDQLLDFMRSTATRGDGTDRDLIWSEYASNDERRLDAESFALLIDLLIAPSFSSEGEAHLPTLLKISLAALDKGQIDYGQWCRGMDALRAAGRELEESLFALSRPAYALCPPARVRLLVALYLSAFAQRDFNEMLREWDLSRELQSLSSHAESWQWIVSKLCTAGELSRIWLAQISYAGENHDIVAPLMYQALRQLTPNALMELRVALLNHGALKELLSELEHSFESDPSLASLECSLALLEMSDHLRERMAEYYIERVRPQIENKSDVERMLAILRWYWDMDLHADFWQRMLPCLEQDVAADLLAYLDSELRSLNLRMKPPLKMPAKLSSMAVLNKLDTCCSMELRRVLTTDFSSDLLKTYMEPLSKAEKNAFIQAIVMKTLRRGCQVRLHTHLLRLRDGQPRLAWGDAYEQAFHSMKDAMHPGSDESESLAYFFCDVLERAYSEDFSLQLIESASEILLSTLSPADFKKWQKRVAIISREHCDVPCDVQAIDDLYQRYSPSLITRIWKFLVGNKG